MLPFRVSFEFAGESYENVALVWDESRRRHHEHGRGLAALFGEREEPELVPASGEAGAGWSMDVPVALALLAAVERGDATAAQARELLAGQVLRYSQASGCCPECDDQIDNFQTELERHAKALRRFDDPTTYPYLVTSSTIHDWNCPHVGTMRPAHPGKTVSEWVHATPWDDNGRSGPYRITPEGATRWLDRRTGPKGGRNWKRCRTCQPELPGAWASEANSTSSASPVR